MFVILAGVVTGYLFTVNQLSKRAAGKTTEVLLSIDRDERLAG